MTRSVLRNPLLLTYLPADEALDMARVSGVMSQLSSPSLLLWLPKFGHTFCCLSLLLPLRSYPKLFYVIATSSLILIKFSDVFSPDIYKRDLGRSLAWAISAEFKVCLFAASLTSAR